jgi:hypothetical protein
LIAARRAAIPPRGRLSLTTNKAENFSNYFCARHFLFNFSFKEEKFSALPFCSLAEGGMRRRFPPYAALRAAGKFLVLITVDLILAFIYYYNRY